MTVTLRTPLRISPKGLITVLLCALVGLATITIISVYLIEEYSEQLSEVPCREGCQTNVPPSSGLKVVQLGEGQLVNGGYDYSLLLAPEPPPAINASSVFFEVFNPASGANLSLENATLSYPNGTAFAFYNASKTGWFTNSTEPLSEVSVLKLVCATDLSGDSLGYWTHEDGHIVVIGIA
jgi:hypothetical protein